MIHHIIINIFIKMVLHCTFTTFSSMIHHIVIFKIFENVVLFSISTIQLLRISITIQDTSIKKTIPGHGWSYCHLQSLENGTSLRPHHFLEYQLLEWILILIKNKRWFTGMIHFIIIFKIFEKVVLFSTSTIFLKLIVMLMIFNAWFSQLIINFSELVQQSRETSTKNDSWGWYIILSSSKSSKKLYSLVPLSGSLCCWWFPTRVLVNWLSTFHN